MSDYVTHFADFADDDCHEVFGTEARTLCGLVVEGIIMNDRPATCPVCHAAHVSKGWPFPLPATVSA